LHVFISTGEVSGDLQGALLIAALWRVAESQGLALRVTALGGPRMAAAGATLLADTSAIGSIGLWESLPFVLPTLGIQRRSRQALAADPPDVVVLIDYLGPNLGMGTALKADFPHVPIAHYIAPQEWVWTLNGNDTRRVVRNSDRILAIFPAEARYYERQGAQVTWVGHPLVDRLATAPSRTAARQHLGIDPETLAIALVPASRRQELRYLMPVLMAAAQQIQAARPQAQFWIPLALERYREPIAQAIQHFGLNARMVSDADGADAWAKVPTGAPTAAAPEPWSASLTCLAAADVAIAKSGTVNLETALLNVPQVVAYRVSPATAWVARHLLNFSIPFMSPPNLVEMQPIVPELLQDAATPEAIAEATLQLLEPETRQTTLAAYAQMRQALGGGGACDRAAAAIVQLANQGG
jgi:lipid-A-disaccharide synthase